jgi:hypothetical protein
LPGFGSGPRCANLDVPTTYPQADDVAGTCPRPHCAPLTSGFLAMQYAGVAGLGPAPRRADDGYAADIIVTTMP